MEKNFGKHSAYKEAMDRARVIKNPEIKKQENKKGFVPIVLILVVTVTLIIGGGLWYFFATQPKTPSASSNLKTPSNDNDQFGKERIAQFIGYPDPKCPPTKFGVSIIDSKMLFMGRDQSCQSPGKILYLNEVGRVEVICAFPREILNSPYINPYQKIKPSSGNCIDIRYQELFNTIIANSDKKDLGLGSSHTVEQYSYEEISQIQKENEGKGSDNRRSNDLWNLSRAIKTYLAQGNSLSGCEAGKEYKSSNGYGPIDGTGWLPIDFTKIAGTPPFKQLDFDIYTLYDPAYHFSFACDPVKNLYELDMKTVIKHDWALEDGGNNPDLYELGNNLELMK